MEKQLKVNGGHQLSVVSSFVFIIRKKFIQVWNNLRMTEFSFLGELTLS